MILEDDLTEQSPWVQKKPYEAFTSDPRATVNKNLQNAGQALIGSGLLASPDKVL